MIENLGVDLGEALMMIVRVFGWQWCDSKAGDTLRLPGIPQDKIDMVIDFFRCNYRTRYKITAREFHRKMLAEISEYKRDYEYECNLNIGKPWELSRW